MSRASAHPDRHREIMRNYMQTERYKQTRKAYRDREREAIRATRKDWYNRNREAIRARRRENEARPDVRARKNERARAWQAAHRRERFYYHLRYEYGLEPEQYDAMLIAQNGCCAICGDATDLHVDHQHVADGTVRGLLCGPCNSGLGYFRDDPERLLAAVRYLS